MRTIRKKSILFPLIAVLAALFLLAVLIFLRVDERSDEPGPDTLRLWYVENERFTALLEQAEETGALSGTGISLNIRSFENEEDLADALDMERPEMLFCVGDTAEALSLNGSLHGISSAFDPECCRYGCFSGNAAFEAGEFFPLMLDAEVMVLRAEDEDVPASFEAFISDTAEDGPVFACSSYYRLFEAITAGNGHPFTGDRIVDSENGSFVTAYNLLAECALNGGLYSGSLEPLDAVREGECRCCCVSSSVLESAGLPDDCCVFIPASDGMVPAEAMGIAVTAEDDLLASQCAAVIGRLIPIASSDASLFPVSSEHGQFPHGTTKIIIKGYVPGTDAVAQGFDEDITRMLSILCG